MHKRKFLVAKMQDIFSIPVAKENRLLMIDSKQMSQETMRLSQMVVVLLQDTIKLNSVYRICFIPCIW